MSFLDRLGQGPPLLLDGGLGSLLISRGLAAGRPPEGWVLDRPDALRQAHAEYVAAGSEAVHCCTFGANRFRLAAFGLDHRLELVNRRAVRLAREAGAAWVLGDVGPTGEYLAPVGQGDEAAWRRAFEEQGRILGSCEIDALHVETMTDLREARIALAALQATAPALPVLVSCTFDRKKRGFFTVMGDPLARVIAALAGDGAQAVGANCSVTSSDMLALAEEALAAAAGLPVVLQPNAGQPRIADGSVHYDQSPEAFADDMARVAALGVRVVGGCCGTDPAFIGRLRRALDGGPA